MPVGDEGGMVGVWVRSEDMSGIIDCDALLISVCGDDLDLLAPYFVAFGIFGRVAKRRRPARTVTDYRVGKLLDSGIDLCGGLG